MNVELHCFAATRGWTQEDMEIASRLRPSTQVGMAKDICFRTHDGLDASIMKIINDPELSVSASIFREGF